MSDDSELDAAQEFLEAHPDEPESADAYHAYVHGRCTRKIVLNAAKLIRERQKAIMGSDETQRALRALVDALERCVACAHRPATIERGIVDYGGWHFCDECHATRPATDASYVIGLPHAAALREAVRLLACGAT